MEETGLTLIDLFGTIVDLNYLIVTVVIIVILAVVAVYAFLRGGKADAVMTIVKVFDTSGYAETYPVLKEDASHIMWKEGDVEHEAKHSHPIFPAGQNVREYWIPKGSDATVNPNDVGEELFNSYKQFLLKYNSALDPEKLHEIFKKTRSAGGLMQQVAHFYGQLQGKLSSSQALKQYWFTFLMVGGFGVLLGITLDIFVLRGVHIGP